MSKKASLLIKALERRVKDNQFFRDDAAEKKRWCDAARYDSIAIGLQLAIGQVLHEFGMTKRRRSSTNRASGK